MWLLSNAPRLRIGANLLVTVFLGFTKDPYPGGRKVALDGLSKASEAGISVGDVGIVEGCFSRVVELLGDAEDEVRAAAIRVVDRWGQMLAATKSESDYNDSSDFLFIQICSMVRGMSVTVRLEAFYAIGRIKVISDNILLLTLSKRIQGAMIVNKFFGLSSGKQYELPTSTVAGVFLHGLEDEFSEGLLGYFVFQVANDDSWKLFQAESDQMEGKNGHQKKRLVVVVALICVVLLALFLTIMFYFRGKLLRKFKYTRKGTMISFSSDSHDLKAFSNADISKATNNFASQNKLGEGGYGPVYKGKLKNGQEIAVKRLSKTSTQGYEEFKNEVTLTASLQYINLVKVLGFCMDRDEQMLVYWSLVI